MGLALPENELLADLRHDVDTLIYFLIGVLAAGVLFVVALAKKSSDRLRAIAKRPKYYQASEDELRSLIQGGEQERLELKSTLRWNLRANKAGPEIERAWLKTLVAFLNTDGGTLLVGVRDNGEVSGLESDRFPNEDKFLLHFNNKFKQHVGLEQAALISVAIRSVDDKRILVVDCDPSTDPVFLRNGDQEEFFVRIGSGTRHLPASKVLEYVKKRSPA
jgi:predicted HTH transcriptional regulator